jgi:hypothetical protein
MRSKLTYANIVATLALLLGMSGGAIAASNYLITSTKQISPKVLRALHGTRGQTGAQGAQGIQGLKGDQGIQGPKGDTGQAGPSARWALVNSDATIIEQSGGITASLPYGGSDYIVDFGSSVAGMDVIVTESQKNGGVPGSIHAAPCGGGADSTGSTCVGTIANSPNYVHVYTVDSAGSSSPHAFYITVLP